MLALVKSPSFSTCAACLWCLSRTHPTGCATTAKSTWRLDLCRTLPLPLPLLVFHHPRSAPMRICPCSLKRIQRESIVVSPLLRKMRRNHQQSASATLRSPLFHPPCSIWNIDKNSYCRRVKLIIHRSTSLLLPRQAKLPSPQSHVQTRSPSLSQEVVTRAVPVQVKTPPISWKIDRRLVILR